MSSEDSDDEPLAVLAAAKKENPENLSDDSDTETKFVYAPKPKKKRPSKTTPPRLKRLPVTFKLSKYITAPVVQRPLDVWLYLKDLNPTGPFSCLLCSEWFLSRGKLIIHYVLNHKKDFCGICRYFVADRDTWNSHISFHTPWPCSQCNEKLPDEAELRMHLLFAHNLVHCRLCHFRVLGDQYDAHLSEKHSVTGDSYKDEDTLWDLHNEESQMFNCKLCRQPENLCSKFFDHYMGFHHFTLKCFTRVISGNDVPFKVSGVAVSQKFIDTYKDQPKFGYVDLDKSRIETQEESKRDIVMLDEIGIKQEVMSEDEENGDAEKNEKSDDEDDECDKDVEVDDKDDVVDDAEVKKHLEKIRNYKGDLDFDVTQMELIIIDKCYFDYINQIMIDIDANTIPENCYIAYTKYQDAPVEIDCSLCKTKENTLNAFATHMLKWHSVKSVPAYFCRICATTFDSQLDLDTHNVEELGDFDDLWLCQFCDKEFENRELTRRHMTEHWDIIEYDNCFSPHLGFKCKYCPTLFWNETDRENHQVKVHFQKFKTDYYKCECSQLFSDKVWFIHHYLEKHHEKDSKQLILLKCCICCIVTKTVEDMRSHFNLDHPEAQKIYCSLDDCKYKPLSHKKSFQIHVRVQHTRPRKELPVTCGICAKAFTTVRSRNSHVAAAHGSQQGGRFRCKVCDERLHSVEERKLHYLISHPGIHPFECTVCGKTFPYKSSLYLHKQIHSSNNTPQPTYNCNYCQKVFAKKDSFREHIQIHEGPRHACSYCPMRFVQRSNLLRHERRHTGERPYECPQCPRTFADKGACNSHARTHSERNRFTCLYCGQKFVQKSKLTYHIRKHTGENLETCKVCSKTFTSVCSLREHMKTHDKKMDITINCPLCDRAYHDERYMLRHLRNAHTGSDKHECPLCSKIVSTPAGLRMHVLTHSTYNAYRCKKCPKSYAVTRTIVRHLRKRHGLKGTANAKHMYTTLDPRDCELGLSEEVIMSIFGPRKIHYKSLLTKEDFAKDKQYKRKNKDKKSKKDDDSTEEENNPEDDESSEDNNEEEGEPSQECDLEPTDFVSIKIEPIEEEDGEEYIRD